ncbi:MAG: DUF1616 domain-containing protein [Nitrososphaerota archaeon]
MDKTRNCQIENTIIRIIREKKPQTAEELTILAKEQLQIPDREIIKSVLKLQSEGKIKFEKCRFPPKSFIAYIQTEQSFWYWITMLISALTTIAAFTISENLYPWAYIRNVLGAIFVLWLPGYTFIKMLFPECPPKNGEKNLDKLERVALSIGMSLALVPLVGLLLNYTPWGIRLTPIVLSLLALTTVFATVALLREYWNLVKTKAKS